MRKEYMHSYNSILLLVHQYLGKNWSLLNYSNKVLTVQHECGFIQKFDNYRLLYNRKITNKYESCPACIKRHIVIKQLNSYKEIAEKNNLKILINSKSLNKDINGIIIFNRKLQLPVKCNICGYEYFSTGNNIQQGKSCPKCAKKKRSTILSLVYPKKNIDAFKIMVRELTGDEYSVLSEEYIDNKTKLQLIHNSCNTIYDVRPNDFQQGYRCPICSLENQKSKNHKLIEEFLLNLSNEFNYNIDMEVKIYKEYRYDFLFNNKYLIEYDGKQHFFVHPKSNWNLEKTQNNDKIKNKIALEKNYKLIRLAFDIPINIIFIILYELLVNKVILENLIEKYCVFYQSKKNNYNIENYYNRCKMRVPS